MSLETNHLSASGDRSVADVGLQQRLGTGTARRGSNRCTNPCVLGRI